MKYSILYIGSFCLPDYNAAAHRVLNNAKLLREIGHFVVFLDVQPECSENLQQTERQISGFNAYSRKMRIIKDRVKYTYDISAIDSLILKYNINMIIAYDYPSLATLRLIHKHGKRIKICTDCTEWYVGKGRRFPYNVFIAIDTFIRMHIVNHKVDGMICISDYLQSYYKCKNQCVKIPPLIDKEDSIWHQNTNREMDGRLHLLCFDIPSKNIIKESIEPIVNAVLASSINICLSVIGITKEEFENKYKYVIDIKYLDRIEFIERIAYRECIKKMAEADGVVIWRNKNRVTSAGFSTKFVESFTAGTMVITNNTGELEQYIKKYGGGYIVNDEREMIDAFCNLQDTINKKNVKQTAGRDVFDIKNYKNDVEKWINCL